MKRILVDMSATLIHHGHTRLLAKASKLGKVIVALTSDSEIIAKNWDKLGPLRAVDEAFKSGVINRNEFYLWYKKTINPKYLHYRLI